MDSHGAGAVCKRERFEIKLARFKASAYIAMAELADKLEIPFVQKLEMALAGMPWRGRSNSVQ